MYFFEFIFLFLIFTKCHFFSELDIGEDWPESEDESELTEYASEQNPVQIERKNSEVVQITPDQRKSSTGSQVRNVTYL